MLTGMLVGLVVAGGCQSTSPLPKSLTREASLKLPPSTASQNQSPAPGDIAWKKSANAPSSAMAQDNWSTAPKPDVPVRTAAFQAQPAPKAEWMPPIPEVMHKDKNEPAVPIEMQPQPVIHAKRVGKHHGTTSVPHAPNELNPIGLPSYVIRPADVLTVELLPQFVRDKKDQSLKSDKIGLNQPIYGPHPVHQDGTISLGIYGLVMIAGRTVVEAREEIARAIYRRLNPETIEYKDVLNNLKVDISNYNNGFYYVITNYAGAGAGPGSVGIGEAVERFPVYGTETVLDAISKIRGLPNMTSPSRIWLARANPGPGPETILPVDWKGITQHGVMATNWQVLPGDRIYLQAFPMRRFDFVLTRVITPLQRVLGVAQGFHALSSGNNTNLVAPPIP
jgi:polysaccharide export outer membrane protein